MNSNKRPETMQRITTKELADAFIEREETYRSILSMYDTMYENIATAQTPESFKKAIVHIMDYDENTMDANAKLGAIDALLQSQE